MDVCTLLSKSHFILHNALAFFHSPPSCFSTQPPWAHMQTQVSTVQRFSSSPFLQSFIIIDQYSPNQLHPSLHPTAGGREYTEHKSNLPAPFPSRKDLSGKVQVVPPLHRGNLSVNVKIINKIHLVTVPSAGTQHGNILLALLTVFCWMQKGLAAHCTVFWNVSIEHAGWSREI